MKQSKVEIVILGSGTCIPTKDRGPSGIIIIVNSEILLFDSGSCTLNKLVKIGLDYRKLKYLFYSHTHVDHTSDLAPLLQALYISSLKNKKAGIIITGPPDFSIFYKRLSQAYGEWMYASEIGVQINEMLYDEINYSFGTVSTLPMNHSRKSIGFRLETSNHKTITYSGDTDYCHEIVKLAQNSDILILECSFPDDQKTEGHLTPSLAATIATESNSKHLILTHFYPECDNIDILPVCKKIYKGEITLAHDLKRIIL